MAEEIVLAPNQSKSADATLHLIEVEDARAFGCVPTAADGRVTAFLEKMDNPVTNQINAGCYVFNPRVISSIPLETVVSVERETFPQLVSNGAKIYGYLENAYWLDIGTPKALLKASTDIVLRSGPSLVMPDAQVDSTAFYGQELAVVAAVVIGGVTIMGGSGTVVGAVIGALLVQTIQGGLAALGVDAFWKAAINGLLLIIAIYADRVLAVRNEKQLLAQRIRERI